VRAKGWLSDGTSARPSRQLGKGFDESTWPASKASCGRPSGVRSQVGAAGPRERTRSRPNSHLNLSLAPRPAEVRTLTGLAPVNQLR